MNCWPEVRPESKPLLMGVHGASNVDWETECCCDPLNRRTCQSPNKHCECTVCLRGEVEGDESANLSRDGRGREGDTVGASDRDLRKEIRQSPSEHIENNLQ